MWRNHERPGQHPAAGCDRHENIMFSTDFPHAAGDWPNTAKVIDDMFAGVPEDEKHVMLAAMP